ncbi:hypothetical protein KRZ98_17365 [Sphingobium sp. AS12]|uniref:hypothetical protein n=1 Tax=Sphingobium sp. AS12 TaxID=2849495 RepID=UPI001C3192CF|nr:hypothetical protein [Sphingobium sp. AS12]MBV2150015.1 hypothetical protein [Sphingobium sp. AS12]
MLSDNSGERRPTISDVSRCYRLLLGREVENVAVAGQQIVASKTVGDLFERIWHSQESARYRIGESFRSVPALLSESEAKDAARPEQLDQLWARTIDTWARRGFGSYYQWLGRNEVRFDGRNPKWNIEHALDSGEAEASELLEYCRRHGRTIEATDKVAVFGAEAFRLGAVLAPRVGQYLHLEVVPRDLEFGSQALAFRGHTNALGMMVADLRGGNEQFDLFYTVSALQYAPPPMIADLLRISLESLRPGGFLVCQLPCQLHGYSFDLDTHLSEGGRDPMGEIHALAQREVFAILEAGDAVALGVVPDGRVGPLGISFTFIARKRD